MLLVLLVLVVVVVTVVVTLPNLTSVECRTEVRFSVDKTWTACRSTLK